MSDPFFFNLAASGALTVRVSPLVVSVVLDAYQRRPAGAERCVGALLGRLNGSTVEVTDAFAIPSQEAAIDKEYFKKALTLAKRRPVGRHTVAESVVGWFSTGTLEASWLLTHNFFSSSESKFTVSSNLTSPLLLTIDPTREDETLNLRCFTAAPTVGAESLVQFQQVPTELMTYQGWADALGVVASASSVVGDAKIAVSKELTSSQLIADLQAKKSIGTILPNLEAAEEVLTVVQVAEACERQLLALS
jgi:JAB1/Mov34/MPN/PAD-1 ubiquitin protease